MIKDTRSTYRLTVSTLQNLSDRINDILAEDGDHQLTDIDAYFSTTTISDMQGGRRTQTIGDITIEFQEDDE